MDLASFPGSDDPATEVKEKTIAEVNDCTVDFEKITTDLYSGEHILLQFSLVANSVDGKSELELMQRQVTSEAIKLLAAKTGEELMGTDGLLTFEAQLINNVNRLMKDGKVVDVLITTKVIQ
ncbi:flagellar basal body-associated FliL family protein [Rubeoparvulum massiliense]|uniref:flagellar basal body-associated FliL family protein n=1 Tax=Rubeoparvulum massiliense TaxID=1631346 RepID=UPI00065DE565|nr:flagellar basal body-associated FliL family protein [Rubeoparvulum massiliense]